LGASLLASSPSSRVRPRSSPTWQCGASSRSSTPPPSRSACIGAASTRPSSSHRRPT